MTLTPNEVYALVGLPAEPERPHPGRRGDGRETSLPKVQMPNRNGFIVDDRPDTKATRCMTNCS